jgi:AraC-like DNA-binding protein
MASKMASITSAVPRALLAALSERGLDTGPLWRLVGLDPSAPPSPELHVAAARHLALCDAAARLSQDPATFAWAGSRFRIEALEVYGFLALTSSTLAEAYARGARLRALYNRGASWELVTHGGLATLRWQPWIVPRASARGAQAADELAVAEMVGALRQLLEAAWPPAAVRFAHACPGGERDFTRYLGVAPEWEAEHHEVELTAELAQAAPARADERLARYFETQAAEVLSRTEEQPALVAAVRAQLVRGMTGQLPEAKDVARTLGMSSRALRRQLANEGTGFRELVDEVRSELAQRYLLRRSLTVSEVAYLLGFIDVSAFTKAFRRWTGTTPGTYRATRLGVDPHGEP